MDLEKTVRASSGSSIRLALGSKEVQLSCMGVAVRLFGRASGTGFRFMHNGSLYAGCSSGKGPIAAGRNWPSSHTA
jgi:hypothetical protein